MQIYRAIPQEVLESLIEYLSHRPHREVAQVMPVLENLEFCRPQTNFSESQIEGEQ